MHKGFEVKKGIMGTKKGSFPNNLVLSKMLMSLKTKSLRKKIGYSKVSSSRHTFCNHCCISDVKITQTLLTQEGAKILLLFFVARLSVKNFLIKNLMGSQHISFHQNTANS